MNFLVVDEAELVGKIQDVSSWDSFEICWLLVVGVVCEKRTHRKNRNFPPKPQNILCHSKTGLDFALTSHLLLAFVK
jgi:hypothetical protein